MTVGSESEGSVGGDRAQLTMFDASGAPLRTIAVALGSSDSWARNTSVVLWFEVAMALTSVAVAFGNGPPLLPAPSR